jgi:hypothetical protein
MPCECLASLDISASDALKRHTNITPPTGALAGSMKYLTGGRDP